jgi:hypothetical protein
MLRIEMAKRLTIAAFVVAVLGAGLVTFAPLGRSCGVSDGGPERCRGVSSFEIDGAWILVVVSVPVLVSLLAAVVRRRAWTAVSAVLLWTLCVLGLASIGLYFVPAAVLLTVASAMQDQRSAFAPG